MTEYFKNMESIKQFHGKRKSILCHNKEMKDRIAELRENKFDDFTKKL